MDWWDVLAQLGVLGLAFGATGGAVTVLRLLPWGKDWSVGSYH